MGKKDKALEVAPKESAIDDAKAARAFDLTVQGFDHNRIAEELDVTPWLAKELASVGFMRLAVQQADELRAVVEARLDDLIRRLYEDLRVAGSQTMRNSIYSLILKADAQRVGLLGLQIPVGTPDA